MGRTIGVPLKQLSVIETVSLILQGTVTLWVNISRFTKTLICVLNIVVPSLQKKICANNTEVEKGEYWLSAAHPASCDRQRVKNTSFYGLNPIWQQSHSKKAVIKTELLLGMITQCPLNQGKFKHKRTERASHAEIHFFSPESID